MRPITVCVAPLAVWSLPLNALGLNPDSCSAMVRSPAAQLWGAPVASMASWIQLSTPPVVPLLPPRVDRADAPRAGCMAALSTAAKSLTGGWTGGAGFSWASRARISETRASIAAMPSISLLSVDRTTT